MSDLAEGLVCADTVARTSIGMSRNYTWCGRTEFINTPNRSYSFVLTNQSCEYKWGLGTMTLLCIPWAVIGEEDT